MQKYFKGLLSKNKIKIQVVLNNGTMNEPDTNIYTFLSRILMLLRFLKIKKV